MSSNTHGVSRRVFMKSGALALATIGLNPSFLRRTVFAQDLLKGAALNGNARGKVLIVLFQRGAADALNVVVPHGEAAYYKMRPNIAIPRPVSGAAQSAIDLDGFFGLHPSLSPFKRMWEDGILFTPSAFPAAPLNRGGIRLSITASNTEEQVDQLLVALGRVRNFLTPPTAAPVTTPQRIAAAS